MKKILIIIVIISLTLNVILTIAVIQDNRASSYEPETVYYFDTVTGDHIYTYGTDAIATGESYYSGIRSNVESQSDSACIATGNFYYAGMGCHVESHQSGSACIATNTANIEK